MYRAAIATTIATLLLSCGIAVIDDDHQPHHIATATAEEDPPACVTCECDCPPAPPPETAPTYKVACDTVVTDAAGVTTQWAVLELPGIPAAELVSMSAALERPPQDWPAGFVAISTQVVLRDGALAAYCGITADGAASWFAAFR